MNGHRAASSQPSDSPPPDAATAKPQRRRQATFLLPIAFIFPSPLNPRKTFEKDELKDLAESAKAHGILQPILVRPTYKLQKGKGHEIRPELYWQEPPNFPTMHYELVDGERRWRSAQLAGLTELPAIIRDLSDQEVLEIALITCEQRADVPLLEKARGYKQLLDNHNYNVEDLAAKIGKSPANIYGLLKALNAPPTAIEAFEQGKISLNHLVLIGRIPSPALRDKAAARIIQPTEFRYQYHMPGQALSFREAKEVIEQDFMIELKGSPFDRKSLTLLPDVGSCDACPRMTGNNRKEYPEGRADVCTDPECFRKKVAQHKKNEVEKAKGKGFKVLPAGEAKKALNSFSGQNNWVDLGRQCWEDKEKRSYKQLLGDEVKEDIHVAHDEKGKVHYLVPRERADAILADKGIVKPRTSTAHNAQDWQEQHRKEREFKDAVRTNALKQLLARTREDPAKAARVVLEEDLEGWQPEHIEGLGQVLGVEPSAVMATIAKEDPLTIFVLMRLDEYLDTFDMAWSFKQHPKLVEGLDLAAIKAQTKQQLKDKAKAEKAAAKVAAKGLSKPVQNDPPAEAPSKTPKEGDDLVAAVRRALKIPPPAPVGRRTSKNVEMGDFDDVLIANLNVKGQKLRLAVVYELKDNGYQTVGDVREQANLEARSIREHLLGKRYIDQSDAEEIASAIEALPKQGAQS